jgi:hypothetical protein
MRPPTAAAAVVIRRVAAKPARVAGRRVDAALLSLVILAVAAPGAAANIPAPVTRANAIRVPAMGDAANGSLRTTVSYSDTSATAAASTGNSIALAKGDYYRLRTCVSYHLHASTPVPTCAERDVDTRSSSAAVLTYAPSVTVSGARPTTQQGAYFTAYSEIVSRTATGVTMRAHGWPDNGLQGAGIAVAAQGQGSGTLPDNNTTNLDSPFTGALNTGQPDSICNAAPRPYAGPGPGPGITAAHAAYAGAPGYYEVGSPSGAHAGNASLGVMLVVHGGAWASNGPGAVQGMRADADRWRERGWTTVNITYRACGQSAADVLWFYDRTRAALGDTKVCALGSSAGGNLALLVAAYRPGLYCVVNQAGPTDLNTVKGEVAYDAASGQHNTTTGGRWLHNLGAAAFGTENLSWFSPAALARGTLKTTRVLNAFSADDALVPWPQAADLSSAMRAANASAYVDNLQLAKGTVPFAHGAVTQAAISDFNAREIQLASGTAGPVGTAQNPLDGSPMAGMPNPTGASKVVVGDAIPAGGTEALAGGRTRSASASIKRLRGGRRVGKAMAALRARSSYRAEGTLRVDIRSGSFAVRRGTWRLTTCYRVLRASAWGAGTATCIKRTVRVTGRTRRLTLPRLTRDLPGRAGYVASYGTATARIAGKTTTYSALNRRRPALLPGSLPTP